MTCRFTFILLALLLCAQAVTPLPAASQEVERFRSTGSAPSTILEGVVLPPEAETLVLSGQTAALPGAPDEPVTAKVTVAELGDTAQQTANVLARIRTTLERRGWAMRDVVKLTVYLVGDPVMAGRMDYAGMNEAYRGFFGSGDNPNLPTRATVQVVALAEPAFLVEIEATAARVPRRP